MNSININEQFTLKIHVNSKDRDSVNKILTDNKCFFFEAPTVFAGFRMFHVQNCHIKRAETIRQLLKNIKVYD